MTRTAHASLVALIIAFVVASTVAAALPGTAYSTPADVTPAPAPDPALDSVLAALEHRLQAFVLAQVQEVQIGNQGWGSEQEDTPIPQVQMDTTRLRTYLKGNARNAPACTHPEFSLPGFSPATRLRTQVNVVLRCAHQGKKGQLSIPVTLRLIGTWPVAARPLPPGHTLTEADIVLHRGDLLRLPPGIVRHARELPGQTTTQRIAARQPFKHNILRSAHAVTRGQPLTLQIRTPAYTLTSIGTALEDGKPGNRLRARTATGHTVHGRLLNARTLVVDPG